MRTLWIGRATSGLAILFLLMDSVMHLVHPAPVTEAFNRLGFPISLSAPLGVLELLCLGIYAFPRSAVPGAVLLTGYLGGAVALHVRVGDPLFDTIFPVIIGALVWGGLYWRDERMRAVVLFSNNFKGETQV